MKHYYILKVILLVLLTSICGRIYADEIALINNVYYDLDKSYRAATLSSVSRWSGTTFVIPETVEYDGVTYFVTKIKYKAFQFAPQQLDSLVIEDSNHSLVIEGHTEDEYGSMGVIIGKYRETYSLETYFKSIYIGRDIVNDADSEHANSPFERSRYSLTKLTIGPRVTELDKKRFYGMYNITEVNLSNVQSLGDETFGDCTSLKSVTFNKVKYIGNSTFYNCI